VTWCEQKDKEQLHKNGKMYMMRKTPGWQARIQQTIGYVDGKQKKKEIGKKIFYPSDYGNDVWEARNAAKAYIENLRAAFQIHAPRRKLYGRRRGAEYYVKPSFFTDVRRKTGNEVIDDIKEQANSKMAPLEQRKAWKKEAMRTQIERDIVQEEKGFSQQWRLDLERKKGVDQDELEERLKEVWGNSLRVSGTAKKRVLKSDDWLYDTDEEAPPLPKKKKKA